MQVVELLSGITNNDICGVGERGLRKTAIEALSRAMHTEVDHKDRAFVCEREN